MNPIEHSFSTWPGAQGPGALGAAAESGPATDTARRPHCVSGSQFFSVKRLDESLRKARTFLMSQQNPQGFWVFDLEADVTIPSEYIFLQRFLNREISGGRKSEITQYIRERQLSSGGWPLYTGGSADISASCKAYFALKLLGEKPDAPHMAQARRCILEMGGAARVNVFTRFTLALFGQIPWRTAPAMPIEIMLLPNWFFFHLNKVSYWSRTVIVPLLILYEKRPVCPLSPHEGVRELFPDPPETLFHLDRFQSSGLRKNLFILLDRLLKRVDRWMPNVSREQALRLAEQWTRERMQGTGGIGAIFPAMANAVMALSVLGYSEDDPDYQRGIQALEDLFPPHGESAFCQPCLSPIWDTCLSLSAVLEAGVDPGDPRITRSVEWLLEKQVFSLGDWRTGAPSLAPGGWAFQFENDFYPDLDDTPMVVMALLRAGIGGRNKHRYRLEKAVNWMIGMQSSNGGWGAFDIDNNYLYLNDIPFADHGALLDPATSDVTARCVETLAMLGYDKSFPPIARGLQFLRREQESCGAWFGRWGVNYIYGTWSVLMALRRVGEDLSQAYVQQAVAWLKSCQNSDSGWGESCHTYADPSTAGQGPSTASQTAWALLGLMAAGEVHSRSVQRGIHYLLSTQNAPGGWDEAAYTGTGFPRVFYLRYHGYRQFFPLWALGMYRNLRAGKPTRQDLACRRTPLNLDLPALH